MKKVIYIHQYFKTPEEGGAIRSYHIAKSLVEHGHIVEMITCHNQPYRLENIDGINVHYLPVKYDNSYSFFQRVYSFAKFIILALLKCYNIQNIDVAFVTSTPLTVGIIALWLKRFRGIPYIFEVRDLWPEAPVQLKILQSTILITLTRKLEKQIYHHARQIIALSPGIEKGIKDLCPNTEVYMIPNMADTFFFSEEPFKTHDSDSFTIGYFGAIGYANNLDFILDIADFSQQEKLNVAFRIVGEGTKRDPIIRSAKERKLKNITFMDHMSREEVKNALNSIDACITSFLKVPILETNSPNKFFDGLAAGKLCIVTTKGWLKNLVEKNQCGFYIDSEKPETFPELIKPFLNDKKLLLSHQENALKLANQQFRLEVLTRKICNLVDRI